MKSIDQILRGLALCSTLLAFAGCAGSTADAPAPNVLILGGGSSHDFARWFQQADSATLAGGGATVGYSAEPGEMAERLANADVLYQTANQPFADPALRAAIFRHVSEGNGLIIGHAGAWYNWEDWPEYNRTLVSGGARAHRRYGEFTVSVADTSHAVMRGVPASFSLDDELYRFRPDDAGPGIHVLATARESETDEVYPIVWTVSNPRGRILVNTLGHDGEAHAHPAYQRILRNALHWVNGGS